MLTKQQTALAKKAERVLGFFVAKGLLKVPSIKPKPTVKLDIADVFLVAEQVEPRVLEVLPAAVIHFPKSLLHLDKLPPEMVEVIAAIKRGAETFKNYEWVKYKDMRDWANLELPDGRTKPTAKKKRMKSFRFRPEVIAVLQKQAQAAGLDETSYLEKLLLP